MQPISLNPTETVRATGEAEPVGGTLRGALSARAGLLLLAAQAALVGVSLFIFLQGWRRDFSVPFLFWIDSLFYLMQAKSTIDNGWWWFNPLIGAPFGLDELAFPANGNIDQALVWLVSRFARDPLAAINLAWVLMVVISGPTAMWCFRAIGASWPSAFAMGALFALSPYPIYKNLGHFGMAVYLVPFVCAVALQLASGRLPARGFLRGRGLVLVVGSALLCFNYVYYPFFGCFLLLVGTIAGFVNYRERRILRAGVGFLALMIVCTVVNLLPSMYSWWRHGRPTILGDKAPAQAEVYGLKVRTLVSPTYSHSFPPFKWWSQQETQAQFPLETENGSARLGAVGAIGFLGLLACLLAAPVVMRYRAGALWVGASQLTIWAVLLATIGGFGSLFALLVTPDIRGYARIAPFIGFFSLAGVALAMDSLFGTSRRRIVIASAAVLSLGLLDQSNAAVSLNNEHPKTAADMIQLKRFVRQLESRLPADAMVFQLPFRTYMTDTGVARMGSYEHLRLYMVSRRLRWSFPAFSDEQVAWMKSAERLDPERLPYQLAFEGFAAIVIDRYGYWDNGAVIETAVRAGLTATSVLAQSERYLALDIRPLASAGIVTSKLPTRLPPVSPGMPACAGQPAHSIDRIGSARSPFGAPVRVKRTRSLKVWGWAVDLQNKAPAYDVDVVVDETAFASVHGGDRPDVASYYGQQSYQRSGFVAKIPAYALAGGQHTLGLRVVAADRSCYYEGPRVPIVVN